MPRTMLAESRQVECFPVAVWCTKTTRIGPVYSGAPLTIASLAPQRERVTILGTGRAGSATVAASGARPASAPAGRRPPVRGVPAGEPAGGRAGTGGEMLDGRTGGEVLGGRASGLIRSTRR